MAAPSATATTDPSANQRLARGWVIALGAHAPGRFPLIRHLARVVVVVGILAPTAAVAENAAPRPSAHIGLGPYLTFAAGSGADLVTTMQTLAAMPEAYEANPLLAHGGTAGLVIGKVVTTTAMLVVMRKLVARGHPRIATVLGYAGGAALGGLAAHNAALRR